MNIISNHIRNQITNQLYNEVRNQIDDHVYIEARDRLSVQVNTNVRRQNIKHQVHSQIEFHFKQNRLI